MNDSQQDHSTPGERMRPLVDGSANPEHPKPYVFACFLELNNPRSFDDAAAQANRLASQLEDQTTGVRLLIEDLVEGPGTTEG